jgi:hypothetical protein
MPVMMTAMPRNLALLVLALATASTTQAQDVFATDSTGCSDAKSNEYELN